MTKASSVPTICSCGGISTTAFRTEIRNAAADAIVDARVRAAGLDRQRIDALTKVARPPSMTVTAAGESATRADFAGLLPMGFTILLMISVMSSGQYLLTTTIEEKSSRTMEVILSAVSPLELLTGKILGQMAVGLTILVTYSSMGILGLVSMAMFGLIDPSLLIYLFIFFLITYVIMGSLMAAIGSAVNELREAQSLMTPITLLMMVPWLFWYPISREPNSVFATVVSFLPPMNAFAMLLRLTSTSPPPDVAGLAFDCGRHRRRRRRALVRVARLQDWPSHARPPAKLCDPPEVGETGVTTKRQERSMSHREDAETQGKSISETEKPATPRLCGET